MARPGEAFVRVVGEELLRRPGEPRGVPGDEHCGRDGALSRVRLAALSTQNSTRLFGRGCAAVASMKVHVEPFRCVLIARLRSSARSVATSGTERAPETLRSSP